eukprot:2806772-Amphidinium_carterae.1
MESALLTKQFLATSTFDYSTHLRLLVASACFESPVQCTPTLPEVKAHALQIAIHCCACHRFCWEQLGRLLR